MRTAWVLLLWRANYVGSLIGLVWLPVQLVAKPCLVWRLPASGWWDQLTRQLTAKPQEGPRASAGSLVAEVRVQKTPGLLPAHWWEKPSPGVSTD